MYEQFYGLSERPFSLTANPKFVYLTAGHREALSNLQYGIAEGAGVTALIGEAGTGKTTLIRVTLESKTAQKTYAVYLNNPALSRPEFLQFLAREFNLGPSAAASKTTLLDKLRRVLLKFRDAGLSPALIVDEAQSLPHELLEEIRLLSNIETPNQKLLSIVLAGQPELAERLNERSLRQLKQRIELRCELRPLDLEETGAYIASRIQVAGGDAFSIFAREAISAVHQASRGIPRTISVICNNALTTGFALQQRLIGPDIVHEICRDFDLEETASFVTVPNTRRAPEPSLPAVAAGSHMSAKDVLKLVVSPFRRFSRFQESLVTNKVNEL